MAITTTMKRATVVAVSTLTLALGMTGISHALAYDGQDPVAAGCASDAYTARSTHILARDGSTRVGVVELRYSPSCRTTWIRVRSDWPEPRGYVQRFQDSAKQYCGSPQWGSSFGQYYCYSPMLNDAGYTSNADGYAVNGGDVSYEAITTVY